MGHSKKLNGEELDVKDGVSQGCDSKCFFSILSSKLSARVKWKPFVSEKVRMGL